MRRCSLLDPRYTLLYTLHSSHFVPVLSGSANFFLYSMPTCRFNKTELTTSPPLHQPYHPVFPSTSACFSSSQIRSHIPTRFFPPSISDRWWEMDFPLPGLLCNAHLVRNRLITASPAFELFVQLGAGGWFVLGEAARCAPYLLTPAVSIDPVMKAVWRYVTTVQVAVVVEAVIVIKPSRSAWKSAHFRKLWSPVQ
ncbi:hypothetical protein BDD12DRAFT_363242 [Trichophaea hybrida]|nr:hypothetical protein BDD12DRAFT_363242 [Trichophaea hybrida]